MIICQRMKEIDIEDISLFVLSWIRKEDSYHDKSNTPPVPK